MARNLVDGTISGEATWSARIGMRVADSSEESDVQAIAEQLVKGSSLPEQCFVPAGYGVKPGERVLLVVNSFYDSAVVEAIAQAIVAAQSRVDVVCVDMGLDRPLNEVDEFKGFIHNWPDVPEDNEVRGWIERVKWADRLAQEENYDLLIHGVGQPPIRRGYRSETLPFTSREVFPAATFPHEVWTAINAKAWDMIWHKGRGGKVRITDPEGTDIAFTLCEEYYDPERYKETNSHPFFQETATLGHLFARQTPPLMRDTEDATGVVAGTTNHCSCPYPNAKAYIEGGRVVALEGGGRYGDAWRELLAETEGVHYPEYPDKGLFWWWETGIGTNPKMRRPSNAFMLSGCGTTYERLRSGVVHIGLGTAPLGLSERWASQVGLPYGHLHVHLLNCTYEIACKDGNNIKVIENGHLTALDDPEVIELASNYGDAKELLREVWQAPMPGITEPGDYWKDYAPNPLAWLTSQDRAQVMQVSSSSFAATSHQTTR